MTREYHQTKFSPPAGAADLLLIRHGRTEAARPGVSFPMKDGHGDPALHPEGEEQALAVADRLETEPLSAIYVTNLRRTHQTAAPLASRLKMAPRIEADLREIHLGDWDGGLYRIKAAENAPEFQRAFERQEWGEIPGAETTAQFHARGPGGPVAYCNGPSGRTRGRGGSCGGGRGRDGDCQRVPTVRIQPCGEWLDQPHRGFGRADDHTRV